MIFLIKHKSTNVIYWHRPFEMDFPIASVRGYDQSRFHIHFEAILRIICYVIHFLKTDDANFVSIYILMEFNILNSWYSACFPTKSHI